MTGSPSLFSLILTTQATEDGRITSAIRSSLLSTLVEDIRPLLLSGAATMFVTLVALVRLHAPWTRVWFAADALVLRA